jgi:hypothetical protein
MLSKIECSSAVCPRRVASLCRAGIFFAEAEGLVVVDRARRRVVQYWTDVAVRRRLLDSLSIELSGRYLRQERYGTSLTDDEFDNWSGRVMLRYEPAWLRYDW